MAEEREPEVLPDLPLEETGEEKETPETEEVAAEPEPAEAEKPDNQKEVETLLAQKEHWRKKALKAEEEANRLKKVASRPEGEIADEEFRPRVEFLLENRDLDAAEYDHLATAALRNSGKISLETLREAKESEKGYISYLRKQRSQQRKVPGSTSTTGFSKFHKTPEEIAKMADTEEGRAQIRAYDKLMMEEQGRGI